MTSRPVRGRRRGAWWRRRWLLLAAAVAATQIGILWLVSAPVPTPKPSDPPLFRYRLLTETGAQPASARAMAEGMAWLLTPGVFLVPSVHDFSGEGWLGIPATEVAIESFTTRSRALGYQSVRALPTGKAPISPSDAGPAAQATVSAVSRPIPSVPPVPLPAKGGVSILDGLAGWNLPDSVRVPDVEVAGVPQRAVVRVMVDPAGELASPPLIWESTEEPSADESALEIVRVLKLERRVGATPGGEAAGLDWGLIAVTWPSLATQTDVSSSGREP